MKRKFVLYNFLFLVSITSLLYGNDFQYSTAGFYNHEKNYRKVVNFNVGWKYYRGDVKNAMSTDFDDSKWDVISTPHTVELLPSNASGGRNYQGVVWYRKRFELDDSYSGQKIWIHFEAIMGKSKIYLNGTLIKEHFGGFLPIIIDLSEAGVKLDEKNIIAVCADNSNDTSFPPGKTQETMDFCYFGGIYRDCWLYTTPMVYITDPNYVNTQAGGGIFVSYENVSDKEATVRISTHIKNEENENRRISLKNSLIDESGKTTTSDTKNIILKPGESKTTDQIIRIKQPKLWHPDAPNLYNLVTEVSVNNKSVDGIVTRIGIRSIEFIPLEGLYINGVLFEEKLIGANRHQDFGYIGNAMTNNLHYGDVLKLRSTGMRIIRSAHYPQDPAFMDACDKLGMFVIVATPGWQFWNNDPVFEERAISDIRNMIRRDRNHPSVIFWEPILNETRFPETFAKKAYDAVHEEYPFPGCYAAIDEQSRGSKHYDIIYCAPKQAKFYEDLGKCCFTREFGDCVDDWYSHNSYSRVSRSWGEHGLIHQAKHYAKKDYEGSLTIDQLHKAHKSHIGGTLWHSFDHQRGYHPDPFYGGIMDVFRQPKYSYAMFTSQRDPALKLPIAESGPFIYIANAMSPFSPEDVTVYSNCDSVRLIYTRDNQKTTIQTADAFSLNQPPASRFKLDTIVKPVVKGNPGIPNEPVVFENVFSFVSVRALHRSKQEERAFFTAEGIIDGNVVVSHTQMPSKRSDKIKLSVDNYGITPEANGSDIIVIKASITDERGNLRQLAMEKIAFYVEGEGEIVGDETIGANPCPVECGTAPLLIRATTNPGEIKIIAKLDYDGVNTATPDTLILHSVKPNLELLYSDAPAKCSGTYLKSSIKNNKAKDNESLREDLKKVEDEQKFFEVVH